jgi:hypothetical protein
MTSAMAAAAATVTVGKIPNPGKERSLRQASDHGPMV